MLYFVLFVFMLFQCFLEFFKLLFLNFFLLFSMFLDVPEGSGMFRNVPCSDFFDGPAMFVTLRAK